MKRTIIPAILSWIVGVTFIVGFGYATMSKSYYTKEPIKEFFLAIHFFGGCVGIVSFPTCFLFAPILKRMLPPSGPMRFVVAITFSGFSGLIAMSLWAIVLPFLPNHGNLIYGTAVLIGASFGLFYAIFNRQTPNA